PREPATTRGVRRPAGARSAVGLRFRRGRAGQRRAVGGLRGLSGVPDHHVAIALLVVGDVRARAQRSSEALDLFEQARERVVVGSPTWFSATGRAASLQLSLGALDPELPILHEAYARAMDSEVPQLVVATALDLASSALEVGKYDLALATLRAADAAFTEAAPAYSCMFASLLYGLLDPTADGTARLAAFGREMGNRGRRRLAGRAWQAVAVRHHLQGRLGTALEAYTTSRDHLDGTDWHGERAITLAWEAVARLERGEVRLATARLDAAGTRYGLAERVVRIVQQHAGMIEPAESANPPSPMWRVALTHELCARVTRPDRR
ncbi:MAG: hypothetical protein AAF211_33410, partial [Myxococcota bacterium]